MKAQEYLDQYYPKEERWNISTLNLNGKGLEGELDLSDFVNLKELSLTSILGYSFGSFSRCENKITKLNLINNKKLEMLDCPDNKLTHLELSNNSELKMLDLNRNELTYLDLSNKKQLEILCCQNNRLTHLKLSNSNKLKNISAYGNSINANLDIFSQLTEATSLDLGDISSYKNDFYGSLKSLENCKKLKFLCIGQNRKIVEGLEWLPIENLTRFGCQGTAFQDMLRPFDYDILAWKSVNHPNLITNLDIRQAIIGKIEQAKQTIDDIKNKRCILNCNPTQLTLKMLNYSGSGHSQQCPASSYDKSKRISRLESKIKLLEKVSAFAKSQKTQQTQTNSSTTADKETQTELTKEVIIDLLQKLEVKK